MSDLGTRSGLRFEDFFAANFAVLVVQLNAHTANLVEAQDAVQEAFCRAWPRWQTISAYDDPVGWVRRVAWNIATSRWHPGVTRSFPSGVDLVATGPAQAVLKPVDGRYEGVMTATFHNNGAGSYAYGAVRVALPVGATFDFQGVRVDEWGMDGCTMQTNQVWECVARPSVVPARGGQALVKFRIVVAIAPQPEVMTLEGGRIQHVAFAVNGERTQARDAAPADNVHKFTLVLNPA
jgi:Sigma-70 region 2